MCNSNYFLQNATTVIQIQGKNTSQDDNGFLSNDWVTLYSIRAALTPLRPTMTGVETFTDAQLQSRVSHKALIRYIPELSNTKTSGALRLLLDERVFNILYINNLHLDLKREGKFYQEIVAEENSAEVQ